MSDVTSLLKQVSNGDQVAADQLLPLVYTELRQLAAARMAAEHPGHTLEATALVHEAYLRLVKNDSPDNWNGKAHFFSAAAEAMRRILVESARKKKSQKHGGEHSRQHLIDILEPVVPADLLKLDAALTELAEHDQVAARVVELRYFGGLNHDEIASALNLTIYRARQKWTYARAWLRREIAE